MTTTHDEPILSESLERVRWQLERDPARRRIIDQLFSAYAEWMDTQLENPIARFEDSELVRLVDEASDEDFAVFVRGVLYALLANEARQSGSDGPKTPRQLQAAQLRDSLVSVEPPMPDGALFVLWSFLFPLQHVDGMSPQELARNASFITAPARLEDALEDARSKKDRRHRELARQRAFQAYAHAIRTGDRRARSTNAWVAEGPRDILALYDLCSDRIRKRIKEDVGRLPQVERQDLLTMQARIARAQRVRHSG